MTASVSDRPERRSARTDCAAAATTAAGSDTGASSTMRTPSRNDGPRRRATSVAIADFPTPPGPVSVTSRARPTACSRVAQRRVASDQSADQRGGRRPRRWRPGVRRGSGAAAVPDDGAVEPPSSASRRAQSRRARCRRARSRSSSVKAGEGSRPSSSRWWRRNSAATRSASACRPLRCSATIRRRQSCSRSGSARVSPSSSEMTAPVSPRARRATLRSSTAWSRSSSRRTASGCAHGWSSNPANAEPTQHPSARSSSTMASGGPLGRDLPGRHQVQLEPVGVDRLGRHVEQVAGRPAVQGDSAGRRRPTGGAWTPRSATWRGRSTAGRHPTAPRSTSRVRRRGAARPAGSPAAAAGAARRSRRSRCRPTRPRCRAPGTPSPHHEPPTACASLGDRRITDS